MKKFLTQLALRTIAALPLLAGAADAAIIGGVEFPAGAISFADAVTDYSPVIRSGQPTAPYRNAGNALGIPQGNYVSLGDGGIITLQFVDNYLTGSGSSALDLWIFEVGPDVEDTFVEISRDNRTWFSIGTVAGSTSGIDLDFYGFGPGDRFSWVRLRDDPDEGDDSGATVGADIDAVGAISTVAVVPEPAVGLLITTGVVVLGLRGRRKPQGD